MGVVPVAAAWATYHKNLADVFFGILPTPAPSTSGYDGAGHVANYTYEDKVGAHAIEERLRVCQITRRLFRMPNTGMRYEVDTGFVNTLSIAKFAVRLDNLIEYHRKHAKEPFYQGDIFDRTTVTLLPIEEPITLLLTLKVLVMSPKLVTNGSEEDTTNSGGGINAEFTSEELTNIWCKELVRLIIVARESM